MFLVLIAGFECLLFIIFAGDYFIEQICNIKDNQSIIEKHLKRYGNDFGYFENFKSVMGYNVWLWFFPVSPKLEFDYLEPLFSYSELILEKKKKTKVVSSDFHLMK